MCTIFFSWQECADFPLIVAGNRDEFLERPTAPAALWDDGSGVLAGRDLRSQGTWMGVTGSGRLATVTNFREPGHYIAGAPSRGALPLAFLQGEASPGDFLAGVQRQAERFNGFNLVVGDGSSLWYFGNRGGALRELGPGSYGLSNHLLDTPWPKVVRGRAVFEGIVERLGQRALEERLVAALLDLLADDQVAADDVLPETGLPLDWERALSALFIRHGAYGTRTSTVVLGRADGSLRFVEKGHLTGLVGDFELG